MAVPILDHLPLDSATITIALTVRFGPRLPPPIGIPKPVREFRLEKVQLVPS